MAATFAKHDNDYERFSRPALGEGAVTSHQDWVRPEAPLMLNRPRTDNERREFLRRVIVAHLLESPSPPGQG